MEVSNLDFVKSFHKIGTITGPRRKTVPPSRADPISCVSPNLFIVSCYVLTHTSFYR